MKKALAAFFRRGPLVDIVTVCVPALLRHRLVQPRGSLNGGDNLLVAAAGWGNGRGREPRRRKSVAAEALIEEHVTRAAVDVLDGVLNTAADDGQRIDGRTGVHDAAAASRGNGGDG